MMNRNKHFHFRLTEDGYNKLITDSSNTGLTCSTYLRKLIDQQEVRPMPPDSYSKLVWEISKVGTNINQLVHKANATSHISNTDIDTAVLLLRKIITLMREMG